MISNTSGRAADDEASRTALLEAALRPHIGDIAAPIAAAQLLAYQALLLRWNTAFNLVSRQDTHRLLQRHILDALELLPFVGTGRLLDIGTGGGLPGMVLAIARPDVAVMLLDRAARKVRFLTQARTTLQLDNVEAICGDALNWRSAQGFDTVTTRAVATGERLAAMVLPHLAPDGRLLAQLGTAQPATLPPGLQVRDEHRYQLAGVAGEFRILVMTR